MMPDQFRSHGGQPLELSFSPAIFNRDILTFREARLI